MRIAFLNIYNGIINRGAERTTAELASFLSSNHEIYLLQAGAKRTKEQYKTVIINTPFPKHKDTSSSFLRRFYLDIWSLQILFFSLRALFFLRKMQFDVIVPINGGWQTVICKIFSVFAKNKILIIGRAGIGLDDAWNLFWRPDVFIALTNKAYLWAKERTKGKIICLPNGINLAEFSILGPKANTTLRKPIVLCIGAFTPNKRINLTIYAVAKTNFLSLLVLGDGPQYNYLKKLGESLLGKERFCVKSVSDEEIASYYRVASIFTLVSQSGEAFGNVYLEAMALNLPVVATDDSQRREIIGKAGYYVNPENLNGYAKTLERGVSQKIFNLPRKQAEKYSWSLIGPKYEKVFTSLS